MDISRLAIRSCDSEIKVIVNTCVCFDLDMTLTSRLNGNA